MQITYEQIRRCTDESSISKGKPYCDNGAVGLIIIDEKFIFARVHGSEVYQVQLSLNDDRLNGTCSCPAFANFGPCKHIAATGLAVIKYNQGDRKTTTRSAEQNEEYDELMQALARRTKQELIDIIVAMYSDYADEVDEFE